MLCAVSMAYACCVESCECTAWMSFSKVLACRVCANATPVPRQLWKLLHQARRCDAKQCCDGMRCSRGACHNLPRSGLTRPPAASLMSNNACRLPSCIREVVRCGIVCVSVSEHRHACSHPRLAHSPVYMDNRTCTQSYIPSSRRPSKQERMQACLHACRMCTHSRETECTGSCMPAGRHAAMHMNLHARACADMLACMTADISEGLTACMYARLRVCMGVCMHAGMHASM